MLASSRLTGLLLTATLAACAAGRPALVTSPLVGKPADVTAPALDGREVRISELHGLVRVVDFWATWCDPCRDQLPVLELLARAHRAEGLAVFGVSVDEDRAQLEAFLATTPVGLTVLWDKGGGGNAERLDVQRLPTTLVIDRAGLVRHVHQGYQPRNADLLAAEVRRLLAEPAPPVKAARPAPP